MQLERRLACHGPRTSALRVFFLLVLGLGGVSLVAGCFVLFPNEKRRGALPTKLRGGLGQSARNLAPGSPRST